MKPETLQKLDELRAADWFCAVGQPPPAETEAVLSWMDAVVSCAESKWETLQRDATYLHKLAVYDTIRGLSPEQRRQRDLDAIREEVRQGTFMDTGPYLQFDFPQWDKVREALRPVVTALVEQKAGPVMVREGLPEIVAKRATWDVLYMAMESEFSHVVAVGFFSGIRRYYLDGRFPCGWGGDWPDGRLIIF